MEPMPAGEVFVVRVQVVDMNTADIVMLEFTVKVMVRAVDIDAPVQCENVYPAAGSAVKVTLVPC